MTVYVVFHDNEHNKFILHVHIKSDKYEKNLPHPFQQLRPYALHFVHKAKGKIQKVKMKKTFLTLFSSYGLMLVPYISSQFSDELDWKLGDVLVGGTLLFALAMLVQFLTIKLNGSKWRIPLIIAAVIIFILIWIELAVGIPG